MGTFSSIWPKMASDFHWKDNPINFTLCVSSYWSSLTKRMYRTFWIVGWATQFLTYTVCIDKKLSMFSRAKITEQETFPNRPLGPVTVACSHEVSALHIRVAAAKKGFHQVLVQSVFQADKMTGLQMFWIIQVIIVYFSFFRQGESRWLYLLHFDSICPKIK